MSDPVDDFMLRLREKHGCGVVLIFAVALWLMQLVAELKEFTEEYLPWGVPYWANSQGDKVHNANWFPPTRIEDAWPLWEELAAHFGDSADGDAIIFGHKDGVIGLEILKRGIHEEFKAKAPLAITRAWVWWQMCEKEGE